jgi:hypothetical protein
MKMSQGALLSYIADLDTANLITENLLGVAKNLRYVFSV